MGINERPPDLRSNRIIRGTRILLRLLALLIATRAVRSAARDA